MKIVMPWWFFLLTYLTHVDPVLEQPFLEARLRWLPNIAYVREVRFCSDYTECYRVNDSGGGVFEADTRSIILSSDPVDCPVPRDKQIALLLEHEYGHALGLGHKDKGIMRLGWVDAGDDPTDQDREDVDRLPPAVDRWRVSTSISLF